MPRSINPVPQYFDDSGNILAGGLMYFFESDGATPKLTYAEEAETTPNAHPLPLTADGRLPDCWFSGTATQVLKTAAGVEIWSREDVGSQVNAGDWTSYSASVDYGLNDIVRYNDKYWLSLQTPNQNNTPADGSAYWEELSFIFEYNANYDFLVGDVAKDSSGNLWVSQITPNLANTPSTDNGTNWLPAVNGVKIPEVIALESRTTTNIPLTGGGALTALRVNELQDAGAYTLPLANTVAANQWLDVCKADEFKAFSPTVSRSGSDTITWSAGTDTSFQLNNGTISYRRFVSDGVSDWRIQ